MEDNKDTVKLLPGETDTELEESKAGSKNEGFFRRAFNRTRDAFKSVDEAITGREAARRQEERFQHQVELNEEFSHRLADIIEDTERLRSRLDDEIATLVAASAEQRETFERTAIEIAQQREIFERNATEMAETAKELKETASATETALVQVNNQNQEMQKQAAGYLAKWNNDADALHNDVRSLQSQVANLQQSFKQFLITGSIAFVLLLIAIVYLFIKR